MELYKTKLYQKSLLENYKTIMLIWIGTGIEFQKKLSVYMDKNQIKLDKQKEKKSKVI
jgi:hypothetical protein